MDPSHLGAALALASVVRELPPDTVEAAISESGRREQRVRALPAWLTVYVVLAATLTSGRSYGDAVRLAWQVVPRVTGRHTRADPPTSAAVVRARGRVSVEPFDALARGLSARVRAVGEDGTDVAVLEWVAPGAEPGKLLRPAVWCLRSMAGELRAVESDGRSVEAGVALARGAGASRLHVREVTARGRPTAGSSERLRALRAAAPDLEVEDRGALAGPWLQTGSRDPLLVVQELTARGCTEMVLGLALGSAPATPL